MPLDYDHLATHTLRRAHSRRKEKRRRAKLSEEERKSEDRERKRIKREARQFIDAGAIEDNKEKDNTQPVEVGYYQLIRDLIPRDPATGKPFLIVLGRKLSKINSDGWWDLTIKQQSIVRRKTRRYQSYLVASY